MDADDCRDCLEDWDYLCSILDNMTCQDHFIFGILCDRGRGKGSTYGMEQCDQSSSCGGWGRRLDDGEIDTITPTGVENDGVCVYEYEIDDLDSTTYLLVHDQTGD